MGLIRKNDKSFRPAEVILTLGRLNKGEPKKANGDYGPDTDRFRFTPDDRLFGLPAETEGYSNLAEEVSAKFNQAFGPNPDRLKIQFAYPSLKRSYIADNRHGFDTKKGYTLARICDGEICSYWLDDDFKLHREPIPCAAGDGDICPKKCVPQAKMFFRILGFDYPGIVTLQTKSINDAVRIKDVLETAIDIYPEFQLNEITFNLFRYREKVKTPKFGKQEKWLVGLQVCPRFDKFAEDMRAKRRQMLLEGRSDREPLTETSDEYDYEDPQALWTEYTKFLQAATDAATINQAESWALSQNTLSSRSADIAREAELARDRIRAFGSKSLIEQPVTQWANQKEEPLGKKAKAMIVQVRNELGITNDQVIQIMSEEFPGKTSEEMTLPEVTQFIDALRYEFGAERVVVDSWQ